MDDIKERVESIAAERGMTDDHAFGFWFLEDIEELSSEDAEDTVTGGPWDGGRDAVYYDEEVRVLRIYQMKYSLSHRGRDRAETRRDRGHSGDKRTRAAKPPIDEVWRRIEGLTGAAFETKTGKPFTFTIAGSLLRPSRTNYALSKTEFAKALELCPLDGPGQINTLVRGPAYVWAILHDQRVRGTDW